MIIFTLIQYVKINRLLGKEHLGLNITVSDDDEGIRITSKHKKHLGADKRYRYRKNAIFSDIRKLWVDTLRIADGALCLIGGHDKIPDTAKTIQLTANTNPNDFFERLSFFLDKYHYNFVESNCNDLVLGALKCADIVLDDFIEYGHCQHLCFCFFDPCGIVEINTTPVVMKAAEKYKSFIKNEDKQPSLNTRTKGGSSWH